MANISTGVVFSENTLICSGGMKRRIEPVTHHPPPLGPSGESSVKENLGWQGPGVGARTWGGCRRGGEREAVATVLSLLP